MALGFVAPTRSIGTRGHVARPCPMHSGLGALAFAQLGCGHLDCQRASPPRLLGIEHSASSWIGVRAAFMPGRADWRCVPRSPWPWDSWHRRDASAHSATWRPCPVRSGLKAWVPYAWADIWTSTRAAALRFAHRLSACAARELRDAAAATPTGCGCSGVWLFTTVARPRSACGQCGLGSTWERRNRLSFAALW